MSLLSRLFYRRPPDGLLEFVERVYGRESYFNLNIFMSSSVLVRLLKILEVLVSLHPGRGL